MVIFHIISILFLIFLLYFLTSFSWFSILILVGATIYLFYFIFYLKYSWKILFFYFFIFSFAWIFFTCGKENKVINQSNINVTIVNNKTNYFIVKYKKQNYLLNKKYFYHNQTKTIAAEIDDEIIFNGTTKSIDSIKNFYDYDFRLFLDAINVTQELAIKKNTIPKIINNFSIRNAILKYVNNMPDLIKEYTSLFLFQNNNNSEIVKTFSQWGIVAILVVSGFHINIFFLFLSKILKFIHNKTSRTIVIFFILLFYLYLLNWPIAALRAFLALLLVFIWKYKNWKVNNITILTFTTYLCLLISPLQFYQLGWQLSFGITFLISLINEKFKYYKRINKILILSLIIFLFNIPIQLIINHGFSLFSSLYNIIFSPIIIFYYFILWVNLLVSPILNLNFLIIFLLKIFIFIINFFKIIDIWIVGFQPEVWMIQLFFFIMFALYFFVKFFNWKIFMSIIINFLLLTAIWINQYNKPYYEISMINVGNAMSILVTSPYNTNAILIDAGVEGMNASSDIIYHYVSAKGIKTLDAVFLTHKDTDHTNNFNYLNNHLTINHLYHNENIQHNYFVNNFNQIKNLSYSINNEVVKSSENNRSLVLLFQLFNYRFLITGDIEQFTENLLLEKN